MSALQRENFGEATTECSSQIQHRLTLKTVPETRIEVLRRVDDRMDIVVNNAAFVIPNWTPFTGHSVRLEFRQK
jgi:hypothetical protein